MPPPPPPPPGGPPPMMPPPPVAFTAAKGGPDDRNMLLQSIRKGAKLKKAVTNDKSAPMIGKVTSSSSNNSASPSFRGGTNNSPSPSMGAPNGLGGLFAGGMPKLKPTGKNLGGGSTNSVSSSHSRTAPESPSPKSFTSIQNELKKQMANDNRNMNRGPPPPAPARTYNSVDDSSSRQPFITKNGSSNGMHQNPSLPNLSSPSPSAFHRKTNSNVNISSSTDTTDLAHNNNIGPKPVINHGKPNVAPKPPILNGKLAAPPQKLVINGKQVGRAQSMRSPRSPSPKSPDNNNPDYGNKFGTVRNLSHVLNQNLGHSLGNLSQVKTRPMLNGRPSAPPPSVPSTPPPPPPSKMVKPPNHAPPPPPNVIPQPPNHAPPPPPHRTQPQLPTRVPPSIPTAKVPPPPPRHSSIRDVGSSRRSSTSTLSNEMENRYIFHKVSDFPKPMPFRGVQKTYTSRQAASKQPAPPPPNQIQLANRLWESSTC